MKKITVLTFVFLMLASTVYALTYEVNYDDNGIAYNAEKVLLFGVTGADMAGMKVTAAYWDGEEEGIWEATFDDAGHAIANGLWDDRIPRGFELSLDGDSFHAAWDFGMNPGGWINTLTIEALPGNVVFDVDGEHREDPPSTPDSMYGKEFVLLGADGWDGHVKATYSDQVALNGEFYGDLYGTLTLEFMSGDNYNPRGFNGTGITFMADTDIVVPVPEPGTVLLLGAGLLGLVGFRKRAKK